LARSGHDTPAAGEVPPQIVARPRTCLLHGTQCGWRCQDAARLEECARHRCAVRERGPVGVQVSFSPRGYSVMTPPAGGSMEAAWKRYLRSKGNAEPTRLNALIRL
jgi:hypothetical protein